MVVENTLKGSSCYLFFQFRKTSVMIITKLIRKEFHAVKISLTIPGGLNILRCVKYDCLSVKLLKKKRKLIKIQFLQINLFVYICNLLFKPTRPLISQSIIFINKYFYLIYLNCSIIIITEWHFNEYASHVGSVFVLFFSLKCLVVIFTWCSRVNILHSFLIKLQQQRRTWISLATK